MNQMVRPELVAPVSSAFQKVNLTNSQLGLVRDMNRELTGREFDQFISTSITLGLNPLARQICAILFNKNNAQKRQMAIVTTIMGLRAIADRTGTYRPDDRPARFTYDKEARHPRANPHGIVDCIVSPYRYAHGEWFPVPGQVWWDEVAPIRRFDDGGVALDSRTPWPARPRGQCAKCAEAAALRQGWPENLANVYAEDEMDRALVLDIAPSQIAEDANKEREKALARPKGTIILDLWDDRGLTPVPIEQFHSKVSAFISDHGKEDAKGTMQWVEQQRVSFREFWAHDKAAALDLKQQIERLQQKIAEDEKQASGN